MKKLKDFNFHGKNVLVRCDFNVPLNSKKEVIDDFRIKSILPTVKYLIQKKARVILMSHFEKRGHKFSLKPVVPILEDLLSQEVLFVTDYLDRDSRPNINGKSNFGDVVLLENLRFHKGEKENDELFIKALVRLGDFFVNDAFSVCHRKHASVVGVPNYLPSAAGILLEKELKTFSYLLEKPERPFVFIVGGVKLQSKIGALLHAINLADFILVGSKIEEFILSHQGVLKNRDFSGVTFSQKANFNHPKIIHPLDGVLVSKDNSKIQRKDLISKLTENEDILDIGPQAINSFKKTIKEAKTVVWSGTLGKHEDPDFDQGTKEIAKAIINSSCFSVIGGGETIEFVRKFSLEDGFDFLSTGGGAMLNFLAQEELPGIKALKDKYGN